MTAGKKNASGGTGGTVERNALLAGVVVGRGKTANGALAALGAVLAGGILMDRRGACPYMIGVG